MKKLFLGLFFISSFSFAQIETFNSGESITAEKFNQNFEYSKNTNPGYGHASIGMIIPFHKNAANGLSIPEGWVECDGGTYVVDVNGPLDPDGDGQFTVPDLNNQVYAGGKGRYLRGGTQSGLFNESTARVDNGTEYGYIQTSGSYYGGNMMGFFRDTDAQSVVYSYDSSNQLSLLDNRIQVTAMTVVYIMRVR